MDGGLSNLIPVSITLSKSGKIIMKKETTKEELEKSFLEKSIDQNINEMLKDDNPAAEAVNALIKVRKRKAGEDSEVELKTDLSEDEIKIHTVLGVLSNLIEMKPQDFTKKCILSEVIDKKERKSLSKDRKSRLEIVEVAKQPDVNMPLGTQSGNESFIKRFFTSRKNKQIPPQ